MGALYTEAIKICQGGRFDNESKKYRFLTMAAAARDSAGYALPWAQVGVWYGHSTYMLSKLQYGSYPVHCFDSFEGLCGFTEADGIADEKAAYLKKHFTADEYTVVKNLSDCENIRLRKFVFGQDRDLSEFEREYGFVMIDVDLYQPTKAALEIFWNRTSGGIIFVDDYGFKDFPGCKVAVDEFLAGRSDYLYFIPLPFGGCMIIK